jgi:ABC-2 type transport system ATP-binding protein
MKQKLALSCTLVHEPPLIVLDEPTTGVDPVSRREFWKLLAEFLAQGLTIILATPYLDEAERCSRVALLNDGQVLALDEPGRLRAAMPGRMLEVVTGEPRQALDVLASRLGPERVELFGDRLHAQIDDGTSADQLVDRLAIGGVPDARVRDVTASLEDVFIDLLARAETPASERDRGATGVRGYTS